MTRSRLFEYAILFNPKEQKDAAGNDTTQPTRLLVEPTFALATSEKELAMKAARAIPEEFANKLEQVEIVVRPF